ncbi:MAG: iron-sulfur cluster assembly protein [archaeon GB-1845-036]|nr:iron-sulfur cluster assembly protein [Candidatus Culexmicrobium thermophilum]HDO20875.1 DUF59 domain-containing protein [Candidatus Bathyarchaeota archaeon]
MPNEIEKKIMEKLREVIDPEVGVNVVDMELIKNVKVEGDEAEITMTLTVPSFICPLAKYLVINVKKAAESLPEIREAKVKLIEPL